MCRLCNDRPVAQSRINASDYRCSKCRRSTPAGKAAHDKYMRSDLRRAAAKRCNAKRIWVGHDYHSNAATVEAAHAIRAHIKERRRDFTRQQNREEAQGAA